MQRLYKFSFVAVCLMLVAFSAAGADSNKEDCDENMKPYTGSAEFEKIKSLSGTWTGTGMMHGEEVPMTIEYKTTSGGSAVIETFSPGAPMEMVSIYYEEDGKLIMKHFCMLQNQPVLGVKNSDKDKIEFDLIGGTNMDMSKDMHMHTAVFTFVDENTMTQAWTPYQDGKAAEGAGSVTLTRAQ